MFLPPQFLDELRDKVSLSSVIGKRVKLTRRGHEYTGLCPFHHEKTPSFTINEDKGFYHCFGCGAHGDAIRYLMEAEKLPFTEAVERLADMAGLKIPEESPEQQRLDKMRNSLTAIMEEACSFFQQNLFTMGGAAGKNYLIKRGISGMVAKQFRLGFAGSGSALTQHLQAKGFDINACVKLGLVAKHRETGQLHDYFYNRVMFPILDRRKRVIGFGGRMLEKGEPKYLNSPETTLFHKGEQLYALPNAIDTIRTKNEAILVEGYMDVIALHSAGFTNAVAPLGTALTENQIKLLWQACDEPLICFDGDGAGRKASIRALYRALPILVPGKSLRFVGLPEPMDPDDVIRKKSPETFAQFMKEATGFADMLWQNLLETHFFDTPERLALFEKDVQETLAKIQDATVRGYYQKDFKDRLWKLTHAGNGKRKAAVKPAAPMHTPTPGVSDARMVLAYALTYPEIAESMIEDITAMRLPDRVLSAILEHLTSALLAQSDLTATELKERLGAEAQTTLAAELEMIHKSNKKPDEIQEILTHMIRESRRQILQAEIAQKTEEYFKNPDPRVWESIKDLKKEIENLTESE